MPQKKINGNGRLAFSGMESDIFIEIVTLLGLIPAKPALIPLSAIIGAVYETRPGDGPEAYRSFYVSLTRVVTKASRFFGKNAFFEKVSRGRKKSLQVLLNGCSLALAKQSGNEPA